VGAGLGAPGAVAGGRHPAVLREREHLAYWAGELAGADPNPIPGPARSGDGGRGRGGGGGVVRYAFSAGSGLHRVARRCGIPLRALLVAAHLRVLASLTSSAEVVTALGRAGGDGADHPMPLRVDIGESTWLELGREVLRRWQAGSPHAGPPPEAVAGLRIDSRVDVAGPDARPVPGGGGGEPCALRVEFTVASGSVAAAVHVDPQRVHPSLRARVAGYYERALAHLAADPSAVAARAELRGPDELRAVGSWSAGPAPRADRPASLPAAFRAQVAARPDATAVCDADGTLSYRELAGRVHGLAHRLRTAGVGRGDRAGVCVPRGADLVVALLGVLAAGAAYVPLDPGFPAARLEFIASDAELRCVVAGPGAAVPTASGVPVVPVTGASGNGAPGDGVARVPADGASADGVPATGDRPAAAEDGPMDEPPDEPDGTDPAYVMYTSGSTGRPKGTVVEHRNLAAFLLAMDRAIGISPGERILALTSASFDISVLELLWPLARGAATVVCPERMVERLCGGADSLADLVRRFRPGLVQATPSFLAAVASRPAALGALTGLRALLVGGEALPVGLARQLTGALPGVRVVNMYGPTETTIWSLTHELGRDTDTLPSIPIGRPVAHTTVRVVDALGNDACVGVPGELWIGGPGVARGYAGRPELDRERFVRTPAGRWYRTGDQVRWREDGTLDFLGRTDRQVKLRGHRVELDEIESVLSEHPQVEAAAVVLVRHPERGDEIVAHVRPRPAAPAAVFPAQRVDAGAPCDEDDRSGATPERLRRLGARRVVDVGGGLRGRDAGWDDCLVLGGPAGFGEDDVLALRELPAASADLVVLDCVVRHFPDAAFLTRVLDAAVRVAGPRGAVFAGGVRDVRLLRMCHADDRLRRSPPLTPARAVAADVERLVRHEDELCLAPAFFDALAARHGGPVVRVESRPERTEAARFRWDVTLLGPLRPAPPAPRPVPWTPGALADLAGRAHADGAAMVTGVPNARLARPRAALRALAGAAPDATAWEVARSVWMAEWDGAADPADLVALARERGLTALVGPTRSGRGTRLDVVFHRAL
jgi:amino acid adenylation domain-containing protein